jgi:signal transduction histidine kinase
MTIRTRLLVSNILMIAVPVIVSALVALACLGAVKFSLENDIKPELDTTEDFPESCRKLSVVADNVLSAPPKSWKKKFRIFEEVFVEDNLSYRITDGASVIVEGGTFPPETEKLFGAIATLGNEGYVSDGTHSLYAHAITNANGHFLLLLYGREAETSSHAFKAVLIICIIVLAITIVISVWLTDRFLISFVFRRIEQPLDILSKGVSELRDGNLSYRISYTRNDEFTPVCAGFNDMAAHLKESIESVEKHEANRTELIAGISHDLRTPITSIIAYVEGLLDGIAETPEKQKKYLLTIQQKAQELDHLISQLFLFSKMDLDDFPVHTETCNLRSAVHDIVQSCRDEYKENVCVINEQKSGASDTDITVTADRDLLMRICLNIIGNSVKYRAHDPAQVTVSVAENDGSALLTLSDDGPGVPAESLSMLFTVFYRCDDARKNTAEGSGLGLAIAAKAVQRMNGTIHAENNEGGGLSVIITLPETRQRRTEGDSV